MFEITILATSTTIIFIALVFALYAFRGNLRRWIVLAVAVPVIVIGALRRVVVTYSHLGAESLAPDQLWRDLLAMLFLSMLLLGGVVLIHVGLRAVERSIAELRESQERYHALFANSRDALILLHRASGRFVHANPAALEMFGVDTEAELIRLSPLELSPSRQPDGRLSKDAVQEILSIVNERGSHVYEWTHERVDGTDLIASVMLTKVTTRDETFLQCTLRDITHQKRAEEALRASEEHYDQLARFSRTITWETDAEGLFKKVSDVVSDVLGFEPEELVDKACLYDFAPPSERAARIALIRAVFAEKRPFREHEHEVIAKNGSRLWLSSNGVPLLDEKGGLLGFRGMDTDITDRRRMQAEREKLQEQFAQSQKIECVGRLAGGVAHDFNNKLSVILGYLEVALQDMDLAEPVRGWLEKMETAARSSADLTQQILAFAKKQTIAPRRIELNETIGRLLGMLRRSVAESIELSWEPGTASTPVLMDPVQVDQILANLVLNSRDAIGDVGRITVRTERVSIEDESLSTNGRAAAGEFAVLSVKDDGCGMDEDALPHLFDPFYTTKEVGQGTGLGLATVHGIVEQNGGFIDVSSEAGVGSELRIHLPLCTEEVPTDIPQPIEEAGTGVETILVVEDEEDLLDLYELMLSTLGYDVLATTSPTEALKMAEAHGERIALLITDVVMPVMNGRELAEELTADHPYIKVLFMSGYTEDAIVNRGVLEQNVHFIQKTFSAQSLAKKVREVLASEDAAAA